MFYRGMVYLWVEVKYITSVLYDVFMLLTLVTWAIGNLWLFKSTVISAQVLRGKKSLYLIENGITEVWDVCVGGSIR